ncbi:hypothetical protein JXA48_01655 [Candidatus Woesearchaeota archaeon]|nr:hypothetical protein [Candidatus Woesearchaeota archaeon]
MSGEDLRPASEWEPPAGMMIAGTVLLAAGISNSTTGVCCIGLLMILIAIFWLLKIRMKKLDPNVKELSPRNDLEQRDKHSHSSRISE